MEDRAYKNLAGRLPYPENKSFKHEASVTDDDEGSQVNPTRAFDDETIVPFLAEGRQTSIMPRWGVENRSSSYQMRLSFQYPTTASKQCTTHTVCR